MLKSIVWAMIFFLAASSIAIQPACHNWHEKPVNRVEIKNQKMAE